MGVVPPSKGVENNWKGNNFRRRIYMNLRVRGKKEISDKN